MGKVVGEPYRGKPDVRFDEGAKGKVTYGGIEAPVYRESAGKQLYLHLKLTAPRFYSTNY